MAQYLRRWQLDIDGVEFAKGGSDRQLRIVFDVIVSPQNTQSFADIRLYNLAKSNVISKDSTITLRAGFENSVDQIFSGIITNVLPEREGASTATRMLCKSGSPANDRGSANASYGAGTKVVDVLKDLANSWPRRLELDETQFNDNPVFISGFIADGDIPKILNDLGYQFNFTWVNERGTLVITRKGKTRSTPIFEVNQYTGMIGMPEVNRGPDGLGVNVNMRINPYIRTTSRINVKSEFSTFNTGNIFIQPLSGDSSANGLYNVLAMSYSGDSHGDTWDLTIDAIRPGQAATQTAPNIDAQQSTGSLVWGAKVSKEFRAKVREIANNLGMNADWIMSVIAFETGNSFDPSAFNKSGATGLIQFIPSTARYLGTSTAALSRMTAVQQLDYVERYYEDYASRIRNIGDAYMAVLWPAGINRADSYVLWQKVGKYAREYAQNAGLDKNDDDTITRGEAVERVNDSYKQGLKYLR
ncbi:MULTISPECIES: transglycosylase SLT domain-containing protein [unclassified Methylophaga]|jgi:hypothetical protein|uniref:transglycosylase SLT domain-containing protein n=1 Tax=unclassified Methylophaga TaxID=2629249 RepID=UPI00259CE0CE|nr:MULTISPECIES: transglycosylase SLT domain-containing protein [unclassified Methylophaga]|tara:strand:- start:10517 stop:11932 length:1416 start_codon:yes stop_codon:yes gene_type:complete